MDKALPTTLGLMLCWVVAGCSAALSGADPQLAPDAGDPSPDQQLIAQPVCGDGTCNGNERCDSCQADCGRCGDPTPSCGDGSCSGEDCASCPADCGACGPVARCGDGRCSYASENCQSCASDCGACNAGGGALYYASANGAGDGKSSTSPFRIADFWKVAKPGDTLLLLDGHYVGASSMINPPDGLAGTDQQPITVMALNDGKVDIDGEGTHRPVTLGGNPHFVLRGFNAHSAGPANAHVVSINRSDYSKVYRVVAWDAAPDGNNNIFGVHNSNFNLLEDCAGFGAARKVFSNAQGGNDLTCRRCFGRWEGNHASGPKHTFATSYNSYRFTCENCIGTWDSILMKQSYDLLEYDGSLVSPLEHFDNYEVDMPLGIFSHDSPDGGNPRETHNKILGSIAFLLASDRWSNGWRTWFGLITMSLPEIEIRDTLAFIEPAAYLAYTTVALEDGGSNNTAHNMTVIGGAGPKIASGWSQSDNYASDNCNQLKADGAIVNPSIAGVQGGATIVNRIVEGKLTDKPLWPWPMNQRILDAMTEAKRKPLDVTQTVFGLCGGQVPAL